MSKDQSTKEKGDSGEEEAAAFLRSLGYTILEMKWRYSRFEIDIIAENETYLVFVEVKKRYSNVYGEPWEAVKAGKRRRICLGADAYIKEKDSDKEPRFDIISIIQEGNTSKLLHIEEAFYPMV